MKRNCLMENRIKICSNCSEITTHVWTERKLVFQIFDRNFITWFFSFHLHYHEFDTNFLLLSVWSFDQTQISTEGKRVHDFARIPSQSWLVPMKFKSTRCANIWIKPEQLLESAADTGGKRKNVHDFIINIPIFPLPNKVQPESQTVSEHFNKIRTKLFEQSEISTGRKEIFNTILFKNSNLPSFQSS